MGRTTRPTNHLMMNPRIGADHHMTLRGDGLQSEETGLLPAAFVTSYSQYLD